MQAEQTTGKARRSVLEQSEQTEIQPQANRCWRFKAVGRGLRQGKEGQALVEFALTLPFLILLFVVLVELGLLIRSHMTVTSSVRESVRVVSARGNADPAVLVTSDGKIYGGNDVNNRVGQDGDTVLVQNVNTSLGQESSNITLLMTFRADATEVNTTYVKDPTTGQTVATGIGQYGIGGAYGVFYNPNISLFPFQEIFDAKFITATANSPQKVVFLPTVMSPTKCAQVYITGNASYPGFNTAANAGTVKPTAANLAGNTYTGPAFCGDASSPAITRTIALGQINGAANNATAVYGKKRFPTDAGTCTQDATNGNQVVYIDAIRCFRYNYAPWYPALRRSSDVGLLPQTNPVVAGYYNNQFEDASEFGDDNPNSGNRAPDYAGVQMNYTHPWFLSFFPGSLPLSDRAVKLMEPTGGNFQQPSKPVAPTPG